MPQLARCLPLSDRMHTRDSASVSLFMIPISLWWGRRRWLLRLWRGQARAAIAIAATAVSCNVPGLQARVNAEVTRMFWCGDRDKF